VGVKDVTCDLPADRQSVLALKTSDCLLATDDDGDHTLMTATAATAFLNAVVGDSGSGGTKGMVPAAAAGGPAKDAGAESQWRVRRCRPYQRASGKDRKLFAGQCRQGQDGGARRRDILYADGWSRIGLRRRLRRPHRQ